MATAYLFWMLECGTCHTRRVVRDFYGDTDTENVNRGRRECAPGRPLPERYICLQGCTGRLRIVSNVCSPDDDTIWLGESRVPRPLSQPQRDEYKALIREAGLVWDPPPVPSLIERIRDRVNYFLLWGRWGS